ncbi:Proline-rich protein 12 [Dirofilaria immitis]|nr:Proline-rich protein 12 [Dirofilaria immitis]
MTTLPASCNIYTSIWDIDFTNINREEASKGSIKDYEEQRGPERGKGRERRGLRAAAPVRRGHLIFSGTLYLSYLDSFEKEEFVCSNNNIMRLILIVVGSVRTVQLIRLIKNSLIALTGIAICCTSVPGYVGVIFRNTSSHPLLPPGFTNPSFASTFSGITPAAGNVSNPLLASTLHHLQELSVAQGTAGLLPNSSQLTLGTQFAAELNNIAAVSWPPAPNANTAWLEQAKVAAILPIEAGTLNPEIELTVQNSIATNSAVIPSSAVPVNTDNFCCKVENNNVHNLSSQPSTPQQRSQQPNAAMTSTQSSPASAMLVIDRQPASIQSHCSTEMRPCSTSSMDPSSVPNHSSVGSVDHLPGSVGKTPMPETVSTMRPCSQQSSSSYVMPRGNDSSSAQSPAQISAMPVGSRNSSAEQKTLDAGVANRSTELRAIPSNVRNVTALGTSTEVDQSSSIVQQTSSTPHENGADNNNLEDLPWSSIDLADIDLFSGSSVAEKDVMHSVLDEMDPTVMHRLFLNEPSTAAGATKLPMNVSQLVTPKIREKIKLKREKELADADKELDRLLSLVAKKDATSTPVSKISKPLQALDPILMTKADTTDDHKISLSPVQFTPPDSPTPSTSGGVSSALCNFFFPSSSASTSTTAFRPRPTRSEIPSAKTPLDDAYSFKDDEEESKPLPSGATVSEIQLREQRLEAEVAQRLARINSAHPELKTKIGSDEPHYQQDLWRHVVPKKRHSAASERPSVPSTPLLPPASVNEHRTESSSSQKVAEPQTIVDLLLRRKQHRSSFGFLKTKSLGDKETAKNEQQTGPSVITIRVEPKIDCSTENGAQLEQPLPKLLIRLPRRSIDENTMEYEKPKKKRRKRKKRDSDHEWVYRDDSGSNIACAGIYLSHCEEEFTNRQDGHWSTSESVNKETPFFSKKRRLIMHWNEREEIVWNQHYLYHFINMTAECFWHFVLIIEHYRDRNSSVSFESNDGHSKHPESSQHSVLSKFHPVEGHLAKGTFVVCKADILKEDCPLWRVDNQNLLQKYPPFNLDGKIAYRNSSTYSGWCDQIADSYIVVRVRFIKHSRSESIVQPEMPLLDMFPAISIEYEERPSDDPIRKQMAVYVKAMLNHALDMTFLQTVRQKSDWNYLCALNGIDKLNQERKEKVQLRVKWVQRYLDLLHFYSSCVICDSEGSGLSCQACGLSGVEKVVQLFCNEGYDYDTLEAEEVCYTGSGSPLHAVEYLVCSSCAKLSRIYHKLHHMRYMLLKNCEDKLEKVSAGNTDMSSEFVVETCMDDAIWLRSVVSEYADLWRKIEMNAC